MFSAVAILYAISGLHVFPLLIYDKVVLDTPQRSESCLKFKLHFAIAKPKRNLSIRNVITPFKYSSLQEHNNR